MLYSLYFKHTNITLIIVVWSFYLFKLSFTEVQYYYIIFENRYIAKYNNLTGDRVSVRSLASAYRFCCYCRHLCAILTV